MSNNPEKFHDVSKKPEPNHDDVMLTAEIASGHPTGGGPIPSDEKETDLIVRSILMNQWGINEDLHPLATGSTSRVWRTSNVIVKLARDEVNHFNAGLRASQAVEASGLEAGTPIRNRSGALSTRVSVGNDDWMLAVLHHVKGTPTSLHEIEPIVLGELLAKIHMSLREINVTGAWTLREVLDHMRQGMSDQQSISTRLMITSAIEAVGDWYRESNPRQQLIRGDGPEFLVQDGAISGMIDWGGVRFGSVVDDIGCWTLHGATRSIREYTTEFVRGYKTVGSITPQEELAIPLFQQLRLASRACYVTDPTSLDAIKRWMSSIR